MLRRWHRTLSATRPPPSELIEGDLLPPAALPPGKQKSNGALLPHGREKTHLGY